MCRFLCYKGPGILLSHLLYQPENSLILQSYKAKERSEPLNGDGFGIGWYALETSPIPGVFASVTPAWSNRNLKNLAEHIKSDCFFAHVRAASFGMAVSESNCHPFRYGRYLWMHNGEIAGFSRIKRRLRDSLPDLLYNAIEGSTDSEYAFLLFLKMLGNAERQASTAEIENALVATIQELESWSGQAKISEPSYYNFAVTDGLSIIAIRYVSNPQLEPASLYYAVFNQFEKAGRAVIIASERLNEPRSDWKRVAPNHAITVTSDLRVELKLIPIERR